MLIAAQVLAALLALGGVPWWLSAASLPRWVAGARWPLHDSDARTPAHLHIVVPARDEAVTIGACARALTAVGGDHVRIVVVDDGSSDGTADLAREALADDGRASVHPAPARPAAWAGKAWACRHGAGLADDADYYLFVDADVVVEPRLAGALIRKAEAGFALVSAFGAWHLPTPGVAWLLPALGWLLRGAVDPHAVAAGRLAFANGQVILIRGEVYRELGGHEVVRHEVLDDVGLARAVQEHGGRTAMLWMPDGFVVHAYSTLMDVLRGYRKNLHAGLGRRRALGVLVGAAVLWIYLGPLVALGLSLAALYLGGGGAAAALVCVSAAGVGGAVGLRAVLDLMEGRSPWLAVGQPLAGVGIAAAFWWSALSSRTTWKGRAFVHGRPE